MTIKLFYKKSRIILTHKVNIAQLGLVKKKCVVLTLDCICHGNYSVKCKDIYCTNNAKSCIHFYNLNRPSISKFRIPHRSNSHAVLAKLMKTCQSKEYKSNKKDVSFKWI